MFNYYKKYKDMEFIKNAYQEALQCVIINELGTVKTSDLINAYSMGTITFDKETLLLFSKYLEKNDIKVTIFKPK